MNSSNYRFTLDVQRGQSQVSVPVVLGDTSRSFFISLTDGGVPYRMEDGVLAKLSIKRPTGTHIEEFCIIENHENVRYDFSQNENTAAVEGLHNCDVTLYGGDGGVLTSARFSMVVSERVVNTDDINLSDEDKTAIDNILIAEAARAAAEAARVTAESQRVAAEEARATAEVARQSASAEAVEAANKAADTANEVAAEVNEKLESGAFDGRDGLDGTNGKDGADGVSPVVSVVAITGGYRVTITDATGSHTFDVMNGKDGVNGTSPQASDPVLTDVTLYASAWEGDVSPYAQVVTVPGVTATSKVDLQPSVEQLAIFHDKDLAFVTENEDGVVTVYAIGDKPTNDYTIQATVTEVNVA